jgi:transcriptional regulator with XRE-family HTH domain
MNDTQIIATVAENVRRARKLAGLSQEELAVEAEVDRTYVSQVERGKRNITIVVLARLARAMQTTAAALVSEASDGVKASAAKVRGIRFKQRARIEVMAALSGCSGVTLALLHLEVMSWGHWSRFATAIL